MDGRPPSRSRASAATIQSELPDPPSNSAVRALLRVLEQKGQLRHEQDGPRYVYLPVVPRRVARTHALRRVVESFFEGSPALAAAALVEMAGADGAELDRLEETVRAARDPEGAEEAP